METDFARAAAQSLHIPKPDTHQVAVFLHTTSYNALAKVLGRHAPRVITAHKSIKVLYALITKHVGVDVFPTSIQGFSIHELDYRADLFIEFFDRA